MAKIDTVSCQVCLQTVTKRSTLSLAELGGGRGRACRSHENVQELLESYRREKHLKGQLAKAERALRIISAAAAVRVYHSVQGMSPEFMYERFRYNGGFTPDMIEEVKKEVARRGGPKMTEDEIVTSAFTALDFAKRVKEGQLNG